MSSIRRVGFLGLLLSLLPGPTLVAQAPGDRSTDAVAAVERILAGGDDPEAWTSLADVLSADLEPSLVDIPTPAKLAAAALADTLASRAPAATSSVVSVVEPVWAWLEGLPTLVWLIAAAVAVLGIVAIQFGRWLRRGARPRRRGRGRVPRRGIRRSAPVSRDAARLEARLRARRAA